MLAHVAYMAPEGVSLTFFLVKASLHLVMKEVGEVWVGPWGRYRPRGVTLVKKIW